jgi:Spx/MgsR family transcriptional regulator
MTKVKIYEYPKCSTCQKALKYLSAREVPFDRIDITVQPPTVSEIERMGEAYGGDLRKLFNTSGQVYREMGLGEKLKGMPKSEAVRLLASNGRLVKRPFLLLDKRGLVGFREAEWNEVFASR